jgi:hypothetical protein
MLRIWANATLLGIESAHVMWLRSARLASGGRDAQKECERMAIEKIEAAVDAYSSLFRGASPEKVLNDYRRVVKRNAKRLSNTRRNHARAPRSW